MPGVPVALDPSTKSPGLGLKVNLLAAPPSPGADVLRGLLIGTQSSAGTGTADTVLYEAIGGADDVATLCGPGMPVHLAAVGLFAEHPGAQIDLVIPASPTGVPATQTVVFSGTVTIAQVVKVWIKGVLLTFVWLPTMNATAAGDRFVELVTSNSRKLPVTAANVTGTVTLTAKDDGVWANFVRLRGSLSGGAGGGLVVTAATMASGVGEMNVDLALALVAGREYHLRLACVSEGDIQVGSSTTEIGACKVDIEANKEGLAALLQMQVGASNNTISACKVGVAQLQHGLTQVLLAQNAESLGVEFAGHEMGARLREEGNEPNINRCKAPYRLTNDAQLYMSATPDVDALTLAEREDLLNHGVTPIETSGAGLIYPTRPITTYFTDDRLLDVGRPVGCFAVARDLRTAIPAEYPNAKISDDLVPGDEEPPEGVVQVSEVNGFVRGRMSFWTRTGVVKRDAFREAVEAGALIARVNPSDEHQCDIVVPVEIVAIWAKTSLVVNHVGG